MNYHVDLGGSLILATAYGVFRRRLTKSLRESCRDSSPAHESLSLTHTRTHMTANDACACGSEPDRSPPASAHRHRSTQNVWLTMLVLYPPKPIIGIFMAVRAVGLFSWDGEVRAAYSTACQDKV